MFGQSNKYSISLYCIINKKFELFMNDLDKIMNNIPSFVNLRGSGRKEPQSDEADCGTNN